MNVVWSPLLASSLFKASIVFVEEPGPGPTLFAPISAQVQLSCTVSEGYVIQWSVDLPDQRELSTNEAGVVDVLAERDVTVEGLGSTTSTLSLDIHQEMGSLTNNQTVLMCLAKDPDLIRETKPSGAVEVIFYGMIIMQLVWRVIV